MEKYLLIGIVIMLSACDPSARRLFYPRTEHQYLVLCSQPYNCYRKADLICGSSYKTLVRQLVGESPHLLIFCK